MSNKWELFCIDEQSWYYVFSKDYDYTPVCPTDSGHEISNVKQLIYEKEIFSLPPLNTRIYTKFSRIAVFEYNALNHGNLRRAVILYNRNNNTTNITFEIFDVTNNTSLITKTTTDTGKDLIFNLGTISNPPTGKSIIEINVKVSVLQDVKDIGISISQIIICSE